MAAGGVQQGVGLGFDRGGHHVIGVWVGAVRDGPHAHAREHSARSGELFVQGRRLRGGRHDEDPVQGPAAGQLTVQRDAQQVATDDQKHSAQKHDDEQRLASS